MTTSNRSLAQGRAAFDRRAWGEAFESLARAERDRDFGREDLERLVWSAALSGKDEAFLGALERLHQACLEAGDRRAAARAAFWLGFHLLSLRAASASGWLARAARLVEHEADPCVERGYLLLPEVYRQLAAADDAAAQALAAEAARIGERCGDRDLVALSRNLEGRALVRQGRIDSGLALLDETMVTVTAGELSPLATGIVYCSVLACCQQIYALDRAREWTAALARWCREQPQLVTFTGHCHVYRAELFQLAGAWRDAIEEVGQVCNRTSDADPDVFGAACYRRAELLRLRGALVEAEAAYRVASENGCDPQPGLALLRLTQGRTEMAANAIRRALSTVTAKWKRASLLPAYVEIMLANGELDEARNACLEMEEIAGTFGTDILDAMAAHARGAVACAECDHRGAIAPLQRAFRVWHRAGAPYIAARIRVLLGRAYRQLGDEEGAGLELDAARKVFAELGAESDLAALAAARGRAAPPPSPSGLSKREREVLRLLATGMTNKAIAKALFLSERTVDRHVSNIFTKIGVGTRAAATAFAYENGLV